MIIVLIIIILSTETRPVSTILATILIQATALSRKRVDIVFDTYEMPSIKAMERERSGTCDCKVQDHRTTTDALQISTRH